MSTVLISATGRWPRFLFGCKWVVRRICCLWIAFGVPSGRPSIVRPRGFARRPLLHGLSRIIHQVCLLAFRILFLSTFIFSCLRSSHILWTSPSINLSLLPSWHIIYCESKTRNTYYTCWFLSFNYLSLFSVFLNVIAEEKPKRVIECWCTAPPERSDWPRVRWPKRTVIKPLGWYLNLFIELYHSAF